MQIVTKFSSISFEVKHVNCYLWNIRALLKDPLISALIVGTSMHCSIPLDGNKPIIIIFIFIIKVWITSVPTYVTPYFVTRPAPHSAYV